MNVKIQNHKRPLQCIETNEKLCSFHVVESKCSRGSKGFSRGFLYSPFLCPTPTPHPKCSCWPFLNKRMPTQ